MDDIAAATLEEVRAFFRTYYTPNNAVLTLVGDFEPGRALERVERLVRGDPRRARRCRRSRLPCPPWAASGAR